MFYAAIQGRNDEIEYYLFHGAEVNYYDEESSGPALYYAILQNHPDTVLLLLKYGADIELGYKKIVSPLFLAAEHGLSEIVRILLDHGANRDFTFFDRYPAQVALDNGYPELAQVLIGETLDTSEL